MKKVQDYKKLITEYTLEDVKTGSKKARSLQTIIDSDPELTKDDRQEILGHLLEVVLENLDSSIKDLMVFGSSEDIDKVKSALSTLDNVEKEDDSENEINLN